MLEAPECICAESLGIVGIAAVGHLLNEYRRIESDATALDGCAVLVKVQGSEGAVRTVTLADHSLTTGTTAVRIEIINLLILAFLVFLDNLDQVRSVHHVPTAVGSLIGEYRAVITPLVKVLYRCRPDTDIGTAVTVGTYIV